MTTPYIDPNLIFAENAPTQDKPAAFENYDKGWDESRKKDGRPSIKQMNYLQQQADLKNLYIHENGAALPYKEGISYEEGAVVAKDGILQQLKGGVWVNISAEEVKKYLLAAGVDESELDSEYDFLMQHLAQIAVDKGWDASFVVDGDRNQKQINDEQLQINNDIYNSINVFTKRNNGFISLFEYIPSQYLSDIKDLGSSLTNVGDVSDYIQQALDYAEANLLDVLAPFAYYVVSKKINVPPKIRFVGLGHPYFITTTGFVDTSILNTDHAGQSEYYIDNFYLNGGGLNTPNLNGIHVGGCRNSTFKNIAVTNCPSSAVLVYPTHVDSGDVENIELDHIWSVLSAGIMFKTNSSISRGNITDGTITNCQLTSGDENRVDSYPIYLQASTGKQIFGLKFNRIFTKATDNNHIVINPNGGSIYGNAFDFFTGETWKLGSVGPAFDVDKECLFVLDGHFQNNSFRDFYTTGLQGQGITLGNGSVGNIFDGLVLNDMSTLGFNNRWLYLPDGAKSNNFTNVRIKDSLDVDPTLNASAANTIYSKIIDVSGTNTVTGDRLTSIAPVLVKRSNIFAITGAQLSNYPVSGCTFIAKPDGVEMTIPAGNTVYFLTIPFSVTSNFVGERVSALFNYVCGLMNGMQMSMHLCGSGRAISDTTANKNNYIGFTAPIAENPSLVITFSGNRSSATTILLKDIVICQGDRLPYIYNYQKNYIEN